MSDPTGHEEESANHERWLVSFADFITLLFALFAVLYATSNRDLEKTKQFEDSIRHFLIKTGAFGGSGEKVNQGEKFNSPIEPPIQTYNQGNPLSQETFDEAEKYIEERLTQNEREKYVLDLGVDELGVRLSLSASALYPANLAKFREEAIPFLNKIADFIEHIGRRVMIEGHTSENFSNNRFPSAWEFAGARATAMVRYYVKRHKMSPASFVPVSYGASRPVMDRGKGKSAGRKPSQNDRIELVLLTEDVPL